MAVDRHVTGERKDALANDLFLLEVRLQGLLGTRAAAATDCEKYPRRAETERQESR